MFSDQAEIKAYWERVAEKHKITRNIEFYTEVLSAVWDEHDQVYTIKLRDVRSKDEREIRAEIVVSAVGAFHKPRFPDVSGQERFRGVSMHARIWDHSVDFSNKRVAVIGNGCSATQIVPKLSDETTTHIINFCRTPSWFAERPQATISERTKWIFRNVPFAGRLFRNLIATQMDCAYIIKQSGPLGSYLRRRSERTSLNYIKSLAPEKYHENLTPKYPLGCKRIVVDPGYLACLKRPNVELEFDSITEITETGITTKTGKHYDVDIICYATGYDVVNSSSLSVTGVGGRTMADYYKEQGGPTAYMGTTAPGFPNWYLLLGPNTATGHASVIYSEEVQINYAMQLIEPVIRGQAKSFSPKATATRAYNEWIQDELTRTVWTSCISWYHADDGKGKLVLTWPATQAYLWWLLRKPVWADYDTVGGEKWVKRRRYVSAFKTVVETLVAGAGLGALILIKTGRWDGFKRAVADNVGKLL
ncbi:hypothetical protein FRC07_012956 [Ceratobasidium sp. 392]|nr:hypothetical protein FRC07_012956 [Ceratobasidium sp. 392]